MEKWIYPVIISLFIIALSNIPFVKGQEPNIKVESFVTAPSSGTMGSTISIKVRYKNYGTMSGTIKVEAGVISDQWARGWGWPVTIQPLSVGSTAQCCPGNTFIQDQTVTIPAGGTEDVSFNLVLPTTTTADVCGYNTGYNWDNSFTLYAITFENCWSPGCTGCGATSYVIKDFIITTTPTTTTTTTLPPTPPIITCNYNFIWEAGEDISCFDTIFDFIILPVIIILIVAVIVIAKRKK